MLQLNPPLPLKCPKGDGHAHFVINDGPEADLYWVILIDQTGEIWTYANRHVRGCKNITLGRTYPNGAGIAAPTLLSEAKLVRLLEAVRALVKAGRWECDNEVDEEALWREVGEAAGLIEPSPAKTRQETA